MMISMIVFDKQTLIELLQTDGYYGSTVRFKKVNRKWRDNHELLLHNYEAMKNSRKRIINERDTLKRTLKMTTKYRDKVVELEKRNTKLQSESNVTVGSIQSRNAEIQKLQQENERLHLEREGYIQEIYKMRIELEGLKKEIKKK